jgi:pimeloyl-ACP methyl ester carboxylesterase
MDTYNSPVTEQTIAPESVGRRAPEEGARKRLLAGLPVTERWLSLNGVATAVLEGGAGAPIILLHGPAAYGAQWLRVIPNLVTTHRVIAPDLPGHGASHTFEGAPDIDRVCAWLDELIVATCPTPPVLIGHTIGGAIAARFASARGERLAALVMVDTLGLVAFQPDPEFASALNEFLSAPAPDTYERLWIQCLFDRDAVRNGLGEQWEWINAYALAGLQRPRGIAAVVELMEHFGMPAIPPATLARIAVPTTLIWGRHDRATPLPVAEEAARRYRWPLHVIDGAGDDPTLDQPGMFLSTLRRVLDAS